ncbi:MAG: hypothetical protein ACRD0A_03730 [Acidimicrobiales bacterium]
MSDAEVSEEVIVYGDAPEGGGGGTDVISIPADFYTFYIPAGPVIVNPPDLPPGGGGGDVVNPKDEFAEAETKAVYIAAGFAIVALIPGVGQAVVIGASVAAVGFGLGAYHLGNAADDPPQPAYQRPAGSRVPKRSAITVGDPRLDRSVKQLLSVERQGAVFVDAIECLQGAFMAGDVEWTQRHAEAARSSYIKLGESLATVADALPAITAPLRTQAKSGPAPVDAAGLAKVVSRARAVLGLSPDDEARVDGVLRPAIGRGMPTDAEIRSAGATLRRMGNRLANPVMVDTRFVFGPPPQGP